MIEKDGFYFYYPAQEAGLAKRLIEAHPGMTSFFSDRGLPVSPPLHIILDDHLDQPMVHVSMFPHREIRLPLRAPGVLEDGFLEPDPWRYFLFMGLSFQAIYSERSGIPASLHHLFGEIVSPNLILPDWTLDGISALLYEHYSRSPNNDPLKEQIYTTSGPPDLDKVSNHPEIWPGRMTYRIYGRPFMRWLYDRYGWEKILLFLKLHGKGIIPIEIDGKAVQAFGKRPGRLWELFRAEHAVATTAPPSGLLVSGYWPDPFVYWNGTGVYPGLVSTAVRGRYGYLDDDGWLWMSHYAKGVARIIRQQKDAVRTLSNEHVWDPGPGGVAVTRKGSKPYLLLGLVEDNPKGFFDKTDNALKPTLVAAPPGVIQLSGPVMGRDGRVVVAGNTDGNWDIWLYHNDNWSRLTTESSIEMDPWLDNDGLLFVSDAGGRFQLHTSAMRQLTHSSTAAMLPRGDTYLQLGAGGWKLKKLTPRMKGLTSPPNKAAAVEPQPGTKRHETRSAEKLRAGTIRLKSAAGPYSAVHSIRPNFLMPDMYIGDSSFQFGLSTYARDVTDTYSWDAGLRYDTSENDYSWRLGGNADAFSLRATRYPFSYTTERDLEVDERRHDIKFAWRPLDTDIVEVSANWRHYVDERKAGHDEATAYWGTLTAKKSAGNLNALLQGDWFNNGSQSVHGELAYWFGQEITTALRFQMGKTWGDLKPGHTSFRIGGNSGEGFFTQRPTRLFPLRGFDSNVLDAGFAGAGSLEVFWPLARLQVGYQTLPLFLHNISLGTFVDAGFAAQNPHSEDMLVSTGLELITGMELAWGFMADFRFGVAWPVHQPDDLEQQGPVLLLQIGRPL